VFIVQTLHPPLACGEAPYRDAWRAELRYFATAIWFFRKSASLRTLSPVSRRPWSWSPAPLPPGRTTRE